MIAIDPGALLLGQQICVDQATIQRNQGHVAQPDEPGAVLDHLAEILNADAVAPGFVVARLVGQGHARRDGRHDRVLADPLGVFMHRQEVADAVACAVVIVETVRPKGLAGESVDLIAARAVWKAQGRQPDMALENQGVVFFPDGGRFVETDGARRVGGAVQILSAGIDQEQAVTPDHRAAVGGGVVMAHGAIGVGAGDGAEAGADEMLQFAAIAQDFLLGVHFRNRRRGDLGVQPGQETDPGDAVAF